MFRFPSAYLAAAILCVVCSTTATGQAIIDLVCSGAVQFYEHGTVTPTATRVDLEHNFISTPVGNFRIRKVEETKIWFEDDPEKQSAIQGHTAEGSLDRLSGQMTIWWQRPTERAELRAGLSSKVGMSVELRCSAPTRFF